MITLRKSAERGYSDWGWLQAKYSFSFARYYNPEFMGFHALRVINEDIIGKGRGFDTHPHKDMEIISFIVEGALEHKDTMGHHTKITPGTIQIMTAGTGVMHSEFNPNQDQDTHSIQIWIEPKEKGLEPAYSSFEFASTAKVNHLNLIASGNKDENVGHINQDARIYFLDMQDFKIELVESRYWLQLIDGSAEISGHNIESGDGVAVELEKLEIKNGHGKALLFELC